MRRGRNWKRKLYLPLWMAGVWFLAGCMETENLTPEQQNPITKQHALVHSLYGLPADSFRIIEGTIRPNQFLADLLFQFRLPSDKINQAVKVARNVLDISKIRFGNRYTAFCSNDSTQQLRYFVYEHSPSEYYVIDLADTIKVYKKVKEIRIEKKVSSGEISTSLWDAMITNNINPMIAIELSEIFAWSIDFFGLQAGDRFNVMYEEGYVDSTSIGIMKIYGSCFRHMGQDFYAIPFVQDSMESYFDEQGNSLRKAFLKAPLRFSRISSRFSGSRLHPILKIRRPHYGIDYSAPVGTPVNAIGDGVVMETSFEGEAGRMVKIRHNSVYTTAYLHLRSFAPDIHVGSYVKQGEVIGYVGSTGLSTGPHLDFRFYRNGSPIDPLRVESPSVEPVKAENREAFLKKKEILVGLLDFPQ